MEKRGRDVGARKEGGEVGQEEGRKKRSGSQSLRHRGRKRVFHFLECHVAISEGVAQKEDSCWRNAAISGRVGRHGWNFSFVSKGFQEGKV